MKRCLPDVNALLALLDPMHIHHEGASMVCQRSTHATHLMFPRQKGRDPDRLQWINGPDARWPFHVRLDSENEEIKWFLLSAGSGAGEKRGGKECRNVGYF